MGLGSRTSARDKPARMLPDLSSLASRAAVVCAEDGEMHADLEHRGSSSDDRHTYVRKLLDFETDTPQEEKLRRMRVANDAYLNGELTDDQRFEILYHVVHHMLPSPAYSADMMPYTLTQEQASAFYPALLHASENLMSRLLDSLGGQGQASSFYWQRAHAFVQLYKNLPGRLELPSQPSIDRFLNMSWHYLIPASSKADYLGIFAMLRDFRAFVGTPSNNDFTMNVVLRYLLLKQFNAMGSDVDPKTLVDAEMLATFIKNNGLEKRVAQATLDKLRDIIGKKAAEATRPLLEALMRTVRDNVVP